jgi:hypothetical protein
VVVKVVEHGRKTHREHRPADRAEQLGQEEPARASEPGVLVGEPRACVMGLDPVGDVGGLAALVGTPVGRSASLPSGR